MGQPIHPEILVTRLIKIDLTPNTAGKEASSRTKIGLKPHPILVQLMFRELKVAAVIITIMIPSITV